MSYPGSKGADGVWQRIIGQMPPHDYYLEPFAGSARVFFSKAPAQHNCLIDRSQPAIDDIVTRLRAEKFNEKGQPKVLVLTENAIDYLTKFEKYHLAEGFTRKLPRILIYCDPPYPLATRKGRKYYEHEMSDDDHAALLTVLLQLKCRVMISSYPNALYVDQLRNWRCVRYQVMTRGGKRTECLWCNFPEPESLHDWRFAGRNFRERHSFAKVKNRWLAKLEAMTPRKRGYVLNAIRESVEGRVSSGEKTTSGILAPDSVLPAGR